MRFAFFSILAIVTNPYLIPPNARADDKKDIELREKEERDAVAVEKLLDLENKDWVIAQKRLIVELKKELQKVEQVKLFRLKKIESIEKFQDAKFVSQKVLEGKLTFHDYEIVIEAQSDTPERTKELASFAGNMLHWDNLFRPALCFGPGHGLRVTIGKRKLDFLICFECAKIVVYEGEECQGNFAVAHTKDNPIEELLTEAEKKAKKQP